MKIKSYSGLIAALFIFVGPLRAAPLTTAFTYQGRLIDGGTSANGLYELRFGLFNADLGGSPVGSLRTNANVAVSNGLFTTSIDFGAGVFDGTAYWLDIGVRTNGSLAAFTPLTPRQPLTASPYALYALNAGAATTATTAITANGVAPNSVTGPGIQDATITAAKIANGQVVKTLNGLTDNVTFSAGAGLTLSSTTFSIADGGVSAAKLADAAVITAKLAEGSVTSNKLSTAGAAAGQVLKFNGAQWVLAPDSDTTYSAGAGLSLGGTTFNVNFGGSGGASTAARSDHTHSALDIVAGTLSDARLSANVSLLNASQTFTGSNIFSGVVCLTNTANKFAGRFTGDGGGLTNLPSQAISAEIARAQGAEATLTGNLNNEVARAQGAETTLVNNLNAEITSRKAADTALSSDLSAEIARAQGAESALTGNLNNEITRAIGAENGLWKIAGNAGTTPAANFLGTTDNQALELKVNGTRALRLEPTAIDGNHSGIVNVVAGSPANFVAPGVYGAVIGGGGAANYFGTSSNAVLADFGLVGGGYQNLILNNAIASVVGGGYQNTIGVFAYDSTISGGGVNTIQNDAFDSTIAGGHFNAILSLASGSSIGGGYFNIIQSSAYDSSIGGGAYNTIQANAQFATIPGGNLNSVANSYGFAAGRRAQANHQGAFVWGDSTDADIASTGNDQFVVRASGGFYLYGADGTQLLSLDPAGRLTTLGCIASASDSNLEFKVNGQPALRLEPTVNDMTHSNIVNIVGGSSVNFVAAGVYGATIAGGGAAKYHSASYSSNSVLADFCSIGGGAGNTIQSNCFDSTICGGEINTIQAGATESTISGGSVNTIQTDAFASTIAGGTQNTIQNSAGASTIGGGFNNTITRTAFESTIGGGSGNIVAGDYAVVPGGDLNAAAYKNSFAAGHRARSLHQGAFVWGDSTDANIDSTGNDQFVIRAKGGVRLDGPSLTSLSFGNNVRQMINLWGTNYGIGVQAYTTYFRCDGSSPGNDGFAWYQGGSHSDSQQVAGPGGVPLMYLNFGQLTVFGSVCADNVSCVSDRNAKENFEPLNCRGVLDKVVALPLTKWNYKKEPGNRHIGPMAQDFYAAFGVGPDDKHITTVDEGGVALAAIQGLNEIVKEKEAKISALEQRVADLEKQNAERETRLVRMEAAVGAGLGGRQQASVRKGGAE